MIKSIKSITEFEQEIASGLTLVDFYADWCNPCRMLAPMLEKVDEKLNEVVKIIKVNVDENRSLAERYQIFSIPTMIVFDKNAVKEVIQGYRTDKAIIDILNKYIPK